MEKQTILLIDDDDFHLDLAEIQLQDEYTVIKEISGIDAIGYLTSRDITPDLILLDVFMPDIDGWEVFNRIREIGSLKNIPVIFLTSDTKETSIQRSREIGAADYITKPHDIADLKNRVRAAIEKHKVKAPAA
jgi:DNA-binding response OmpR family regulator